MLHYTAGVAFRTDAFSVFGGLRLTGALYALPSGSTSFVTIPLVARVELRRLALEAYGVSLARSQHWGASLHVTTPGAWTSFFTLRVERITVDMDLITPDDSVTFAAKDVDITMVSAQYGWGF